MPINTRNSKRPKSGLSFIKLFILTNHTFESIQQSCLFLESFTMHDANLSTSTNYQQFNYFITPYTKLTSLCLYEFFVNNPHVFNYLPKKYPSISIIKFDIYITNDIDLQFGKHLYRIIVKANHLNEQKLKIQVIHFFLDQFTYLKYFGSSMYYFLF